ncbi:MAG: DUF4421 domain-containing protein, partial [Bacteroidales bacterium]|nr:DUF4421 domain-containing protein [Bacteroidales bacterium]
FRSFLLNEIKSQGTFLNRIFSVPYDIRGDIRTWMAGLDLYDIFNSARFSCRAAVLQNEWQKKSAGEIVNYLEFV